MTDNLQHSLNTLVYVQFDDGGPCYYLGDCTVLPSLPNPAPDRAAVFSSVGASGFEQIGFEPGAPGALNLTVTTLVTNAAAYLEQIKERGCPFNLYVLTSSCGAAQAINAYERAWVYRNCQITDDPYEGVREPESDVLTTHVFNVTAWNGRVDHRPVTVTRIPTVGTATLRSVAIAPAQCASDCQDYPSPPFAPGKMVLMGADAIGAAIPDYYLTYDGMETITIAASNLPTTSDIEAVAIIHTEDGLQLTGARDAMTGLGAEFSYDLSAATSVVTFGEIPDEGITKDDSLFFLDRRHGWFCTDKGRIYFSGDAGQTWVEQPTAHIQSGGDSLRSICFSDALTGYCAGSLDTLLSTTDGGETWTDNPTGLGEDWLSLHVFNRQRLIVGCYSTVTDGSLYMSHNAGTSWEDVTPWRTVGGATAGYAMRFLADGLTGYVLLDDTSATNSVYKTINGGHDWRQVETPANTWLHSLAICQPNLGYVVGTVHAGTSFIAKISG